MPELWRPERRRTERHAVTFPLHARLDGASVGLPVRGLSVTGLVLESPEPLLTGQTLSFSLDPDERGGAIGPVRGRVVHSRLVLPIRSGAAPAYVAGVAFEALPADIAERIAGLLAAVEDPAAGSHT